MEFKLNGTAEEALQQINDKHYALPFETDGRKLFKIGVNFSAETRNIEKVDRGILNVYRISVRYRKIELTFGCTI